MELLTPIEEHDGWLWKRDDYFIMDGLPEVNGTKLRFLRDTLEKWLFTGYNVIAVRADRYSHSLCTLTRLASHYGKQIVNVATEEEFQALDHEDHVLGIRQSRDGAHRYDYHGIMNQCGNIPENVRNIIVPCGSGHTLYGIMRGLQGRSARTRVYAIGNKPLAALGIGPELMRLALTAGMELVYLNRRRDRPDYGERMDTRGIAPIPLDTHHELNAYLYAKEMLSDLLREQKILFWVVGNYNFLRRQILIGAGQKVR